MKHFSFNFLRRQLFLIMAVIGFSTSMLANTDVTYTEPSYTCDPGKDFDNLTLRYATEMSLTCGENSDTWTHSGTREFYNVLSDFTIDAKAGETVTANFKANNPAYESKNSEDLRWTIATLHIDWNRDGNFESSEIIAGKTGAQIGSGNDNQLYYGNREYIFDITKDIVIPEGTTPGKVRVRLNYTNAWIGNESVSAFATKSKEGIVYDFDINIVEPIESGLEVTWGQPENGTITVKNGTEVLESPATVEPGTKLTIVPAPASGRYELGTLTANDTPITLNDGNYEVTINENTVIAATFEIAKYEINWNEPVNGTIRVVYANDESQEVTKGSKVQLDTELKVIAEPSTSGYVLNRVYYVYGNGTEYDITKGDNGYTFTVQETTNGINTIYINAVFEKVVTYLVSWAGEEVMQGGYLKVVYADSQEEVESDVTEVPEGSVLEIIPLPDEGYSLSALSYQAVGGTGASINIEEKPYTFTVGGGGPNMKYIIISAEFTPSTYTLSTSVTPENGGSVSVTDTEGTPVEGNLTYGQTIVITASANGGYTFESLDVKGATKVDGQENQYTVEGDVTVTATFVEDAPVETWSEVHFNTMSGKDVDFYNDPYYMNPAKSWSKVNSGATVTGDKNNGLYIKQLTAGYYLAYKYRVEKEATYRFSFVHKKGETTDITVKLCYTKDLESTFTDASAATEIPKKGGSDSGDLFQSNNVVLEPGDYYFVYYIETAATGDIKVRIADFKLEMLDGSAVEPTPEYTVTLNKPENGNLSVTYNNGSEDVTVSTDTEAQTFNVAENTKLTVTVTPAEGYQLATLSPDMTKVEDSENVYEYTVTGAVTIEATFTEVPEGAIKPTDAGIKYSTDEVTYLYQITDSRSAEAGKSDFYWTLGLHNDYKAIQVTTEVLSGEDANKQYFFFKEGSDALHFRIYTAEGQNIDYVDGLTGNGWNGGNIGSDVTTKYMQYETTTSGEFMLVSTEYSNEYGIIASNGDLLNTRGTGNDGFVNMSWVINTYSGNNTDDNGSRFKFIEVKDEEPVFEYVPVPIRSGFNTDVIAEAKPSADHTSGTLDSQGWVLFTSDIQEEGALPLDLTTVDNIPYKMADVTSNNAAVLKGENTESTLVFKNPAKAEEVRLLSISAEGASTMEVTVNYDDDTNQTQSFTIADWWNSYGGQGEAYYGLDRIITEYESPYSKDQIDGRKQFRLFEQVVTTDPEKTIVSVKVVNRSTGTKTPSVLGVTVLGELLEVEPIMHSITVKKPVNGNLVISYMANDEMQSIETYNFEEDSKVFSIEEGTVLSISVNPDFDYVLDQILPEGMEEQTGLAGDTYYEYTVTGDATIEAIFKAIQYGKVSAETSEKGTIEIQLHNPMMDKWVPADEFVLEQVEFGTELRAKVEANTGYELVSVMKNQEELSTEEEGYYYFTVDAEEITISAEFEAEEYTLTTEVNPAEGGSVSVTVNGVTVEGSVKYGDVITVTVTVNEGYLLESVVVEGAEEVEGQKDQYTVTGNVTITATFKKDTSSINSIENGTVYYNAEEEILYTGTAKSVRVYDLSGRLVINAENQDNVSLAELAEGIYTAVVDNVTLKLKK